MGHASRSVVRTERADLRVSWYQRGKYWYPKASGSAPAYEKRLCEQCNEEFFARRSRPSTQSRFCSIACSRIGENNPAWRGSNVGYRGAHIRVAKVRGKASFCTRADATCSQTYHWANLTGHYEDVMDYESMCVSHHRRFDCSGESHPNAKLSDAQVREVRARYAQGGITMRALAAQYGISKTGMRNIILERVRVLPPADLALVLGGPKGP